MRINPKNQKPGAPMKPGKGIPSFGTCGRRASYEGGKEEKHN